jgi:hypothetical protein
MQKSGHRAEAVQHLQGKVFVVEVKRSVLILKHEGHRRSLCSEVRIDTRTKTFGRSHM